MLVRAFLGSVHLVRRDAETPSGLLGGEAAFWTDQFTAPFQCGAFETREDARGGRLWTKLKGSIGEGSNHSNFSHQRSVEILSKFRNFR